MKAELYVGALATQFQSSERGYSLSNISLPSGEMGLLAAKQGQRVPRRTYEFIVIRADGSKTGCESLDTLINNICQARCAAHKTKYGMFAGLKMLVLFPTIISDSAFSKDTINHVLNYKSSLQHNVCELPVLINIDPFKMYCPDKPNGFVPGSGTHSLFLRIAQKTLDINLPPSQQSVGQPRKVYPMIATALFATGIGLLYFASTNSSLFYPALIVNSVTSLSGVVAIGHYLTQSQ